MDFSQVAWQAITGLRTQIHQLPFNRELTTGTISQRRFAFYLIQDSLYLEQYARALALVAVKAPNSNTIETFLQYANVALVAERTLHGEMLNTFGVSQAALAQAEQSPSCAAYTNFLLAVAHQFGYNELIAAVLPCFWIYWDVGCAIANAAVQPNRYQRWIETYSDPAFGQSVKEVIAMTDRAAEESTAKTREMMLKAFIRSTQYELLFWQSAYDLEAWPTGV